MKNKKFALIYIISAILLAIPSIVYLIKNKSLLKGSEDFTYFLRLPEYYILEPVLGAIIYGGILISLFVFYLLIIKHRESIFKSTKQIIGFILMVSLIFFIILPMTSTDVLSYATIGEMQSEYHKNPYYTLLKDVKEVNTDNEVLNSISIWDNQTAIYGPLWTLICSIVTFFSFSKIFVAVYLFKFLAIGIHIVNAILVYKITKKKLFLCLYGLNPLILFETISNVHNDLYLVFFILLGLYFLLNKKNIVLTMFFLACAACVKYISILLVPFILIYYYRQHNLKIRLKKIIPMGLIFVGFVGLIYLIYLRDFNILFNVFIQQDKYKDSISASILMLCMKFDIVNIFEYVRTTMKMVFVLGYVLVVGRLLISKNINFMKIIREYNFILIGFLLIFITNSCVWYVTWFMATIMWQRPKTIRFTLYLFLFYELAMTLNFAAYSENAKYTVWYTPIIVALFALLWGGNKLKKKINCVRMKE